MIGEKGRRKPWSKDAQKGGKGTPAYLRCIPGAVDLVAALLLGAALDLLKVSEQSETERRHVNISATSNVATLLWLPGKKQRE